MGPTQRLAEFISKCSFDNLPREVIDKVKLILLDDIGCALGGYAVDKTQIVSEIVREFGGNPQVSIIGGGRSSACMASFMNAELINALDSDILGPFVGHVTPYVTPACLAISELVHAPGKDLILASAIAHEIGGRIAGSLSQSRSPKEDPPYYQATSKYSFGASAFGGTAGACRLLKMDAAKITHALGMTGITIPVPGMMHFHQTSSPCPMAKYNSWPGWVAQIPTWAALLASKGFTSDPSILDGDWGFYKMYGSEFFHEEAIFNRLGSKWDVLEVEFKPYPCCRCQHAAIDGVNKILGEEGLLPEDIDQITIKGDPCLLTPSRSSREVTGAMDTQFIVAYSVANAAFNGRQPSPEWQRPSAYNDPRIKKLMSKVKVVIHPNADKLILNRVSQGKEPIFRDTIVEINAKGKIFTAEVPAPLGSPGNPLDQGDLLEKFDLYANYSSLEKGKVEKAKEYILNLEKVTDVAELATVLRTS